MSENNDTSNESNSLGSESILQASRLTGGGNNQVLRTGVLRPSVLGPSVLSSSVKSGGSAENTSKAKDFIGSNPFLKSQQAEEDEAKDNSGTEKETTPNADDKKSTIDEEPDERPDPLSLLRKNGMERANMFAAAKNSIPRVEKSGFVFGQNVHERVIGENVNAESSTKTDNSDSDTASGELLFCSVIKNVVKPSEGETSTAKETDANAKSLNDVAREYEESRAQKRKFEEVETFTGEENEVNIIDINCKLFAFVNSNWEERGRGSLRLNDSKNEECSRVVFRTAGNLRLLLNTKVWAGMVAERPSQKSLRLTAMDNTGKIKIFLAMARPVEINQLHKALTERIDARKASHPEEIQPVTQASAPDEIETKNGVPKEPKDGIEESTSTNEPEQDQDQDDSGEPSPKKQFDKANN